MYIDLHAEREKLNEGETMCYVTASNGGYIIGTIDKLCHQTIVVTVEEFKQLKKLINDK